MRWAGNLSTVSTLPTKKISKKQASVKNIMLAARLSEIQDKLYAQKKYSLLIILQGMDTSGKDGAVKNVFSGVNPAGCSVKSFKVPTIEESAHQFLWRISKVCPEKGMIQIFNRSHYEDVVMPKINGLLNDKILKERCSQISEFEKALVKNDTIIIKFFLHISQTEQFKRLNARKTDPKKHWKYQKEDIVDIKKHLQYKKAYEFIFRQSTHLCPWHVVPADKKWFKNYTILNTIVNELEKYVIDYPNLKLKSI